jgi:anaerobic selenocysteine-containing dehydrogenase
MAECHPVAYRFVLQAKARGATVIHVDPRFSRTSAMADLHVPIRPGSDIAWLGGLINYVLQNELYFKEYVVNYTNAATIITDEFKDTEDWTASSRATSRTSDPTTSLPSSTATSPFPLPTTTRSDWPPGAPRRPTGIDGEATAAGQHAAGPQLRAQHPQAPLRTLHARDGGAHLRRSQERHFSRWRARWLRTPARSARPSGAMPSAGPSTPPGSR